MTAKFAYFTASKSVLKLDSGLFVRASVLRSGKMVGVEFYNSNFYKIIKLGYYKPHSDQVDAVHCGIYST